MVRNDRVGQAQQSVASEPYVCVGGRIGVGLLRLAEPEAVRHQRAPRRADSRDPAGVEASNGTTGYRKVHAQLAIDGVNVCDRAVREIMAEHGLKSCHPALWRHLTQSDGTPPAPDLTGRDFTADRPGIKLVGDITQIDTWEGPVFLATVIDLFNREVVGRTAPTTRL